MTSTLKTRLMLSTACLAASCTAAPALAQTAPPPRYQNIDGNGVDLTSGQRSLSIVEGAIGAGEGAVTLMRHQSSGARTDNWSGLLYRRTTGGTPLMMVYLWRAVDHEGEILESYVTKTRDRQAALRFMKKALKRHGSPAAIVTDGLKSYRLR